MSAIYVEGGFPLIGQIKVQGSKNSALPILAASILHKGTTTLVNCPHISDVDCMLEILKHIGCNFEWKENTVTIDASDITCVEVPESDAKKMRSSFILLGALLGRKKEAWLTYPGGCSIGNRPVDIHLQMFRDIGVELEEDGEKIHAKLFSFGQNEICFSYPSVGATQNAILTAVLKDGEMILRNCAKEPEIIELCNCLNKMGAQIRGGGTEKIVIRGVKELQDTQYVIGADRIAAGTYLAAAAATKGAVCLKQVDPFFLTSTLDVLARMGCYIRQYTDAVVLSALERSRLKGISLIKTEPYPGFPTDMQSPIMALLSIAEGTSVLVENIFEDRFKTAKELEKMGANICIEGKKAIVCGVESLCGANVRAYDLRGGAALAIAALAADGKTKIDGYQYIARGYEYLCEHIGKLGARILEIGENE